ncbi:protein masquerade [Nephila pilipes]|uniref:Protein masquerade n=1 Tax=Nephila pilipes TaxID=299642 RepID=A0A8X6MY19_NEPPI|nr:protein masquerade [Nephila pilipes]
MVSLSRFVFCFILLLKIGSEPTTMVSTEAVTLPFECPGKCVTEYDCEIFLNDTECPSGLVCCVEYRSESSTETSYLYSPNLGASDMEMATKFLSEGENSESFFEDMDLEHSRYMYYSDSFISEPNVEEKTQPDYCPGVCVLDYILSKCDFITKAPGICTTGTTCCVTEEYALKAHEDEYIYELTDDGSAHVKRVFPFNQEYCPGTCMHDSKLMLCEQISPQYVCPLNSKCCTKRSHDKESSLSTVHECSGQCLSESMLKYCQPPNELILGTTTCKLRTTCCMIRSTEAPDQPPFLYMMEFPYAKGGNIISQVTSGLLAIDDAGIVYRIGTNGQIYRLPRLKNNDLNRIQFKKLMTYPLATGIVAIYEDMEGILYQHLIPPSFVNKPSDEQPEEQSESEEYLKSLSPYSKEPPTSTEEILYGCGIKGRRHTPHVMGGKEAVSVEWCWQVAIINTQNQYICGGVLIGDSWVLTAASCVFGKTNENQVLFVRLGVTDLKSTEDNNKGHTIRVMSTFIHHNFNTINLDNNIALLRLQRPVKLNDNVCVVCLPTSGKMPQDNIKCTVTGYGFVSVEGGMMLKMGEAQVPIIDDTECMANVTESFANPFILPASSFCAGGEGRHNICQGDAGGPLVCKIGDFYELIGLVSWSLGCGRVDVPSVYTKVPAFMGWINQIIGSTLFLASFS